ncbi:unnamed protein product [Gadus morhua 'NCC']
MMEREVPSPIPPLKAWRAPKVSHEGMSEGVAVTFSPAQQSAGASTAGLRPCRVQLKGSCGGPGLGGTLFLGSWLRQDLITPHMRF